MLLVTYGALALLPLLGIVWIVLQGSVTTVDGLFMSLICLTISGIFGTTALFEVLSGRWRSAKSGSGARVSGSAVHSIRATAGPALVEAGRVENVQFFESAIGQPNKSIVTLSDGGSTQRLLVLDGDVRNALPVGKRVEISCREDAGRRILMGVNYS